MSNTSIETWERYRANSPGAADALFQRYLARLTALARSRLSAKLAVRVDADDVVQSAYASFFRRAEEGDFTIAASGDLWRLLAVLTIHKLQGQVEHHTASKRSVHREEPDYPQDAIARLEPASTEPSPSEVLAVHQAVERLLAGLEPLQAQAVQMRLEDFSVPEVAAKLGCTPRTVRRWLHAAKRLLEAQLTADSSPDQQRPNKASLLGPDHVQPSLDYVDYLLQRHIGSGGMGRVYAAVDKRTGAPLAIKILKKHHLRNPLAVARFVRESETLARLRHPRIVALRGLGRMPGGGYFIGMELVHGRDLAEESTVGTFSVTRAAAIVAEVADAIEYAHAENVIHCDLKPANVLLTQEGEVRVTDFGLARALGDDLQPDFVAGTAAFMAPEQVDAAWGTIDRRTDVFGLGGVLYFLLTGRAPNTGSDRAEVLRAASSDQPFAPVSKLRKDVAPALQAICMRCLAKAPAERFATAADVASALRDSIRDSR